MENQRTPPRGGTRGRTAAGDTEAVGTGHVTGSAPAAAGTGQGPGEHQATQSQQSGIVGMVRERATSQLSTQKVKATDGLDSIAQAVRQTTQQLRSQDQAAIAGYIDKAADGLEQLSRRLRDKEVDELMRDARNIARRQPALFIGGSFALGILAARFIKSSQRDGASEYHQRGGETGVERTGAY